MTFYVENETEETLDFDVQELVEQVAVQVLEQERCPYEAQVNVLLTDNDGIREYNRNYRQMDRPTDVLSFPNVEYRTSADFSEAEAPMADCFDPDSGELILGDIILSLDKVREQAAEYGHSRRREFAFLVAHSMLHLCGYDHMEEAQAAVMEARQALALEALHITRED